jgi:formate hydrogenlyase subunit 6/NADH:ubiquinone oxidoreductase subunit I
MRFRYPKLRELKEALTALIKGPYTTKYPYEPHTPMAKFRGKPAPDDKECIACGACAQVCPARAIEVINDTALAPPQRHLIWHYDLCIFCGQCERLCTTEKGVVLNLEYDLATTDRSTLFSATDKELVLCEDCKEIIGTKAQLLWLLKKLGPLSSGNFALTYTAQKDLELVKDTSSGNLNPSTERGDLYRVLCPRCRHQVLIFNQTGKQP